MKVSGWLYVRSRPWTRKRQVYAKLLGEVLTFGPNEHAPATEEYGVRGCRVDVGFRRNAFVVGLGRGHPVGWVRCGLHAGGVL